MYCVSGSSFSFRPAPALCDDIISVLLPLLFLLVVDDLVTVLKNADVVGVVVVVVVALVKPIRTGEKEEEEAKGVVVMILLLVGLGNSRCARMPRESISCLRFQKRVRGKVVKQI
jgi:hypothetical protein